MNSPYTLQDLLNPLPDGGRRPFLVTFRRSGRQTRTYAERPDRSQLVRALREGGVTLLFGVPRLYEALFEGLASRFGPDGKARLESLGWQVAIGYGLTETSPLLTLKLSGDPHHDTVGRPVKGVELRIDPSSGTCLRRCRRRPAAAPARPRRRLLHSQNRARRGHRQRVVGQHGERGGGPHRPGRSCPGGS